MALSRVSSLSMKTPCTQANMTQVYLVTPRTTLSPLT